VSETNRRWLNSKEKEHRDRRIVKMRDVFDLTWAQISARTNLSVPHCAKVYRQVKEKECES